MEHNNPEAVSSGGIVARSYKNTVEILLLGDTRYEDWTLPKGHVEKNETLEQTAIREIREETGVTQAKILFELASFRRYSENAKEWKTIHYFLILTTPDQPKGKLESDYMKTAWFQPDNLPKMYLPEQEKVIKDNLEIIKRADKLTELG